MECRVALEVVLATEHADVGSLERTIATALTDVGRTLWAALVAELEASLPAPVVCAGCGAPVKANGRAPRRLVTLTGEVQLQRRRYRCLSCGTETVPLDLALGLEPRVQHTLGVRERGLWLVASDELCQGGRDRGRAARLVHRTDRAPLASGRSPPRSSGLTGTHLADALRGVIGADRSDRLEQVLVVVEPGDAEGLLELLAGWAFEEAGADLARSDKARHRVGFLSALRVGSQTVLVGPLVRSRPARRHSPQVRSLSSLIGSSVAPNSSPEK